MNDMTDSFLKTMDYKGKVIEFSPENAAEKDIPADELHEHLQNPSTPRTRRLKARCRWKHASAGEFCEKSVTAGIERMRLITAAHKESHGKPETIRRALGLKHILDNSTLVLNTDEFIVGYHAEDPNMFPLYPELSYMAVQDYLQTSYAPQPVSEAREIVNYWKPFSLQARCEKYFDPVDLRRGYQVSTIEGPVFASGYNSVIPPYETVLEDGLQARVRLAEKHIAEPRTEVEKFPWDATKILAQVDKIASG